MFEDDCDSFSHHNRHLTTSYQECSRMKKNSKFYPDIEMKKPQQKPRWVEILQSIKAHRLAVNGERGFSHIHRHSIVSRPYVSIVIVCSFIFFFSSSRADDNNNDDDDSLVFSFCFVVTFYDVVFCASHRVSRPVHTSLCTSVCCVCAQRYGDLNGAECKLLKLEAFFLLSFHVAGNSNRNHFSMVKNWFSLLIGFCCSSCVDSRLQSIE